LQIEIGRQLRTLGEGFLHCIIATSRVWANAREVLRSIQRAKIDVNMRLAIVAAAMAPDAI
jgi:hypothetical protein